MTLDLHVARSRTGEEKQQRERGKVRGRDRGIETELNRQTSRLSFLSIYYTAVVHDPLSSCRRSNVAQRGSRRGRARRTVWHASAVTPSREARGYYKFSGSKRGE